MLHIKNKIDFQNNCWVGEVDFSTANSSELHRIKFVTDIAAISFGRLGQSYKEEEFTDIICKRREDLYHRLLKESGNKYPGTPFEFIPARINLGERLGDPSILDNTLVDKGTLHILNKILKYSYLIDENNNLYLLTNLRVLLKAGVEYKDIPYNTPEEVEGFKVVVCRTDLKSIVHIDRHRAFVFNEESSRNKKYLNEVEFLYPSNWNTKYVEQMKYIDKLHKSNLIESDMYHGFLKPEEATMELSMRRLVKWAMAAWKQDENSWDNLFEVRGDKTGTQSVTKETVYNIKQLISK